MSSFHFAPSAASASTSPSGVSPTSPSPVPSGEVRSTDSPPVVDGARLSPPTDGHSSSTASSRSDAPTPLFDRPSSSASSSTRPLPPTRSISYKADDIWGTSPTDTAPRSLSGGAGVANDSENLFQRTTRAASDGLILAHAFAPANGFPASTSLSAENTRAAGGTGRLSSLSSDEGSDEQAFFREHQRRSLEHTASQSLTSSKGFLSSPPLPPPIAAPGTSLAANRGATSPFFQPPSHLSAASASNTSFPPLLSPTATSPPSSAATAFVAQQQQQQNGEPGPPGSKGATLHLGDLDVWMDEAYVRECCAMMGWDNVVNIKMSRGASPSSGYCFLTFPSGADAARVLNRFNAAPPMLMPRSGRTFKLNWGTGLPGLQPRWDGEFSVFVGDLAREVGESELMALFTPLFPSTKSAKVMCDPSTGLSRGYGFVRFTEESDMQRALLIGSNPTSGLLLHGRTIRISEASGGAAGGPNALEGMGHLRDRTRTRSGEGFHPQQNGQNGQNGHNGHNGQNGHQPPPHVQPQGYFPPYPHPPPPHVPDAYDHPHAHNPYASPPPAGASGGYGPGSSGPFSPGGMSSMNSGGMYGPPIPGPHSGAGGGLMSPTLNGRGPLSPGLAGPAGGEQQRAPVRQPIPQGSVPPGGDPNNTTVFVGGLPACISEETLKSFFHHFGEITYCKIPAGKGCGFVQFVRRQDAELAIAKMNDFPIHGKSRIRLSWGRSQGDKQVEHVRKLASALGVPFDAVWRMVQGQDNSTIKQIASAVGTGASSGAQQTAQQAAGVQQSPPSASSPPSQTNRMDLRAVANAAGLTESEVLDLVKAGASLSPPSNGNSSQSTSTSGSEFFPRSNGGSRDGAPQNGSMTSLESAAAGPASPPTGSDPRGGPYSRVSPSSFSAFSGAAANGQLPLSPPPSAGPGGAASFAAHQQQQQQQYPPVAFHTPSPGPYTQIRPESYALHQPTASPYERVDFADGGRPSSGAGGERYQPQAFGNIGAMGGGKWHEQPHFAAGPDGGNYTTSPPPTGGLEGEFAGLSLQQQHQAHHPYPHPHPPHSQPPYPPAQPRSLPPPLRSHAQAFQPMSAAAGDFFPTALGSPTSTNAPPLPAGVAAREQEAGWSWGGVSA
ncbi:hypothetical protein JCM10213_001964 [Rhodosporidiobolus nylandii]